MNDFSPLFSTLMPSLFQCSQEKNRESNLRVFFKNKNLNFARLYTRLMPVFLLKKCPSFARLFSNMGSSEEFGTLQMHKKFILIHKIPFITQIWSSIEAQITGDLYDQYIKFNDDMTIDLAGTSSNLSSQKYGHPLP